MNKIYVVAFVLLIVFSTNTRGEEVGLFNKTAHLSYIAFSPNVSTSSINLYMSLHEDTFKNTKEYLELSKSGKKNVDFAVVNTTSECVPQYIYLTSKFQPDSEDYYIIKILTQSVDISATNEEHLKSAIKKYFEILLQNGTRTKEGTIVVPVGISTNLQVFK